MLTIEDILDLAVQIEMNGEKAYRSAAEEINDPGLSSILLRLAGEERKHAKWFSELSQRIGKNPAGDPELEEMGKRLLKGILGDQSFSLKDADFSSFRDITSLLELAIEFERDTVLFYEMIRSFSDKHVSLDNLNSVIEEENNHIHLLESFLEHGVVEPE